MSEVKEEDISGEANYGDLFIGIFRKLRDKPISQESKDLIDYLILDPQRIGSMLFLCQKIFEYSPSTFSEMNLCVLRKMLREEE